MKSAAPTRDTRRAPAEPRSGVVRRCACGGKAGAQGECEECRKKRLAIRRTPVGAGVGRADAGLAWVEEALRAPGRPLDEPVRREMAVRLGHDFSNVRVHTDGLAARSARAVEARAYTVGDDIAFGAGEYRPESPDGSRLLAHELAHTIQAGDSGAAVLRPAALASLELGPPGDRFEREAERIADSVTGDAAAIPLLRAAPPALRRVPRDEGPAERPFGNDRSGDPDRAFGEPEARGGETLGYREATELLRCIQTFGEGREAPTCVPARPLTWDDFTGTAPPRGRDANTRPDLREVGYSLGSAECRNLVLGEPLEVRHKIQAFLDARASWVQPRWRLAADPTRNGCERKAVDCERFFDTEAAAGRTGGTRGLGTLAGCPATVQPDPSAVATSRDECRSVLVPACNRREIDESARLLRHEQLHFDIGCVLADKANRMVAAGADSAQVLRGARALLQPLHDRYDADTRHGCLDGPQETWEQDVADGLPSVTIRPLAERRRRRRRRR